MAAYEVPVIDVQALVTGRGDPGAAAEALGAACREAGFFYVVGHGVALDLQARLEELSRRFFALGHEAKMRIAMPKADRAWRGFFPVGGELTSGQPDLK